jgi:hypothetical protein
LLWGRSPHLAEARSGFWKGERASEGRGCFERGTLNADTKANRKGAALFNGLSSSCASQKPAQKLEVTDLTVAQGVGPQTLAWMENLLVPTCLTARFINPEEVREVQAE